MKKGLLYAFLSTTILFTNVLTTNAEPCPIHDNCNKANKIEKQSIHYSPCRFMSETQIRIIAEKKEEFKKRLNITDEQKAELEKIKAHEQKELLPYKKKIEKEEEKLKDLFLKEHEIRIKHSQQFEKLLTNEQKNELQKFKTETMQEMMKFAPPSNMLDEQENTTNEIKAENVEQNKDNTQEISCTCEKENPTEEHNEGLQIKGTDENILKEASTEDFNNIKNTSKFVKENVSDEEVESVAPNEELQPKSLERKVIEPTIAPTPTVQTTQEEITLEK